MADLKEELHRKLQAARAALLSRLEDLGDYDLRRPMTATRELIDGKAGADRDEVLDEPSLRNYLAQIQAAADSFAPVAGPGKPAAPRSRS